MNPWGLGVVALGALLIYTGVRGNYKSVWHMVSGR
jgi:hypothetical protein